MNLYRKVLASIDLGDKETAKRVLYAALEVISGDDTLHVVSIVPDYGMSVVGSFFPPEHEEKAIKRAQEALHAFTAELVPKEVKVQHIIAHGSIYEEVINTANEIGADLIVVGSHRPRIQDYLLGPNAARVVRHARQSVLVARE